MKTYSVLTQTFSASHRLDEGDPCGLRTHGHDWIIRVEFSGSVTDALKNILSLTYELHLRHLNEMVVGAPPTPEGIAPWALERLRPHIPGLRRVSVGFRGHEAIAEV